MLSVWTTWLIVTGSASACTAVKNKIQSVAQSTRETRAPRDGAFLKNSGEVKFIRFNGPTNDGSIASDRSICLLQYKDTSNQQKTPAARIVFLSAGSCWIQRAFFVALRLIGPL